VKWGGGDARRVRTKDRGKTVPNPSNRDHQMKREPSHLKKGGGGEYMELWGEGEEQLKKQGEYYKQRLMSG